MARTVGITSRQHESLLSFLSWRIDSSVARSVDDSCFDFNQWRSRRSLGKILVPSVRQKIKHLERSQPDSKPYCKDGAGGRTGNKIKVLDNVVAASAFNHVVPLC